MSDADVMGMVHQLLLKHGVEEARRIVVGDKNDRLCLEAAYELMTDERARIGIAHAGFAMAALPHKRTTETVWERDGGQVKLLVESGLDSRRQPVGIPYGSIARMILLYLQTQAVRTKSREIELGSSMNAWLTAMGISSGGRTYHLGARTVAPHQPMPADLLSPHRRRRDGHQRRFVRDAILPLNPEAEQMPLWQERVKLDQGFYQSLIDHPLPLREAAIQQISSRSMAIDL